MEIQGPESAADPLDQHDFILNRSALAKLIDLNLITGSVDSLGFLTIGNPLLHFPLPYPSLKFERIPCSYSVKAYLLYLGFKIIEADVIFFKCNLMVQQSSDINAETLLKCANEHVTEYYREPFWATLLEVSLVSEIARLKGNKDSRGMNGYLCRHPGSEKKTFLTLRIEDYIKEAIWQRSANLTMFERTVHAMLNE